MSQWNDNDEKISATHMYIYAYRYVYVCVHTFMCARRKRLIHRGHCCQTYWGLFLRQPEGRGGGRGGGRGDGGRWSGGWLKGGGPRKGGGGGWLALLICKTANLRTLCLPALSSSFSTFSLPPPSLPTADLLALSHLPPSRFLTHTYDIHTHSLPLPVSLYFSLSSHFDSTSLPFSRAFLSPCKHAHQSTLSLSRFCRSLPSHLSAFSHPCGTSRKLYVPTLATLNAGLARDNPRPSPLPSTAAATLRPTIRPSYPSPPPAACPFSLLTDSPPGFTTS